MTFLREVILFVRWVKLTVEEETRSGGEKMKRLKYVVLLGMVLILGACSKDPKAEFIDAYQEIKEEAQYAGAFTVSIPAFETGQELDEASAQILTNTMKDFSVKGNYYFDEERNYQIDLVLDVLDEEIPLELLGNKEAVYLSTSFLEGTLNLMKIFGTEVPLDETQLTQLDQKYLELPMAMVKGLVNSESPEESLAQVPLLDELLQKAKKDSFKKDGDSITYTFTAGELEQLGVNDRLANARQSNLNVSSLTMKINRKTKETGFTMKMKDVDENMQMTGRVKVSPGKKKQKLAFPKTSEILPLAELDALIAPSEGTVEEIPEISEEELKYTDEEFEAFYTEIEAYLPEMTEEEKEEMLVNYQIFLTDEQYSRLQGLLGLG